VTFLDSSVIIDMLEGVPDVVECVEDRGQPYLTSSLCVFEVIDGKVGSGDTDVVGVRQEFGGVRSLDLNEQVAMEAGRMQDRLLDDGERMAARDRAVHGRRTHGRRQRLRNQTSVRHYRRDEPPR